MWHASALPPPHSARKVGTIQYMAPEMLNASGAGAGEHSAAVDIYAFAIILWQVPFRRPPSPSTPIAPSPLPSRPTLIQSSPHAIHRILPFPSYPTSLLSTPPHPTLIHPAPPRSVPSTSLRSIHLTPFHHPHSVPSPSRLPRSFSHAVLHSTVSWRALVVWASCSASPGRA